MEGASPARSEIAGSHPRQPARLPPIRPASTRPVGNRSARATRWSRTVPGRRSSSACPRVTASGGSGPWSPIASTNGSRRRPSGRRPWTDMPRHGVSSVGAPSARPCRRAGAQWNVAAQEIEGWPKARLGLRAVPNRTSLCRHVLRGEPAARDRGLPGGNRRRPGDDLFSEEGQASRKPVSRSTVTARRKYCLRRLLWGAVQSGVRSISSPAPAGHGTCFRQGVAPLAPPARRRGE